jgi:hypothetical protein
MMADHRSFAEEVGELVEQLDGVSGFVLLLAKDDGTYVSASGFQDEWARRALTEPFFDCLENLMKSNVN